MPAKDELVYQGVNESSATFKAYVYTVSDYTGGGYTLRVRDYIGNANNQQQLSIVRDSGNVTLYMSNTTDAFFTANASHIYGDGSAKGSAQFTNFTSITSENGIYTSSRSLLNEIGVVIEDIDNNAFTYELLVEDSLQKYKNVLLGLLHPAGTHYITKNVLKANSVTTIILDTAQDLTYTYSAMTANMSLSGTDVSTNTIVITNAPAYIDTIFEPSDYIQLIDSTSKINVYAKINSVDRTSNTINVESQLPLLYNNVAFGRANSGYNYINVSTITTTYNLINNGEYSDYAHWLKDIVQIGDQLKLGTNSYGYVQNVDYTNNVIYMTNNYSSAIANGNVTIKKIVSTNNITYVKNLGFARFLTEDSYLIVTENNEVLYL
jgi:hypothetical protein